MMTPAARYKGDGRVTIRGIDQGDAVLKRRGREPAIKTTQSVIFAAASLAFFLFLLGERAGAATAPSPSPTPFVPEETLIVPAPDSPEETIWDEAHREIAALLSEQVHRFDSFFGDPGMVDRIRDPWFRIRVGVEWEEGGRFKFKQRFRAFLPLPILERRLGLFLGVDEDGREDDPDYFDTARENPVAAGLRYFFRRHKYFDSSVSLGLRLRSGKPVVYVRPMVKGSFTRDRFFFEPRQYFYWFSDEGFGTETSLGFDYSLRRHLLFRFNPGLIYSETSSGVDFYQRTSLRYLDYLLGDYPHFAVNLELASEGRTRPSTKFDRHQLRLGFRHRIWRPWLRLEYGPRLTWKRRVPDKDDNFSEYWKHHIPSFVVFLEVHFEELTGPSRRD